MKKIIIILSVFLFSFSTYGQRLKKRDVIGTWKLVMNVEEVMKQEADESDTMMEEIFIKTLSGFVGGIIDDIDIYFEFQENNKLKITVNAYDESETGRGSWFINNKGYLLIEDLENNDNLKIDASAEEWKLIDGILITDEQEKDRNVYMAKID